MKTVAVSGSNGFVGSHLIRALQDYNYSIIEIDTNEGVDLINPDQASKIPEFDVVVHLAANSFVPRSYEEPYEFYYTNYMLTLNILELARRNGAQIIFFSSYLYGNPEYLPIDEGHPLAPHNPYAQSKLICEKLCEGYSRDFGIPVIIFRPFNIFGAGQSGSFLIPLILDQIKTGVISLKDPRPKRDYIYISDIVEATIHAINSNLKGVEVFNLGFGNSHSVSDIVNIILSLSNKSAEIVFSNDYRKGEVLDTVASTAKIYDLLNWRPSIDLREGLKRIMNL